MKIDLKKEDNNVITMEIEIPAKDAVEEYNRAVKKISNYVNIPGFRKGKAPRNLVEKHVGVESIKHEALEALLPNIFRKAIIDNELDVISQPSVESYDFNVGEDIKVIAKVELRPEVTLGDYKNLKIEVEEIKQPADAFDQALNGLLQQHSTFNIVVDRPAKETDIVVIDFDGSVNGEKIQGGAGQNYPLDLANSNFIPGFAEKIVGHKLDEEFDITVEFPKDYHEAKLAGQPAVFAIKLKEIKEKVLPELTEKFVQKIGPFKTVEDLKADIQKYIDTTTKNENQRKADNAIFEKVLEGVKIDIQPSMIEKEAQSLFEDYNQRLTSQGYNPQEAIQAQGLENLLAKFKEEAAMRIKNSLVIDKIAQVEEIKIDPSDLEQKFKELEATYRIERAELLKQLNQNPALFNSMSQQALNQKVMAFLSENNKVKIKA